MNSTLRQGLCIFIVLLLQSKHALPQDGVPNPEESTPENASTKTGSTTDETSPSATTPTKSAPDTQAIRLAQLQAAYPPEDLMELEANGAKFTSLWKKDQSGEALGAVLILPSDGQTANWPNTIDVIRNELPQDGWSTLSIDIENEIASNSNATKQAADSEINPDANTARIEAAIAFLHGQGQYNIVLAGYGHSARRILNYASRSDAPGMNRNLKSTQGTKLKRPVRALILISPLSLEGERLSSKLGKFPYKDMPILDIIFGHHYLDTFDAKARQETARASRIKHYLQIKSVEPSASAKVFGQQNRLSRRIRGFLDSHAKGVEIERR